MNKALLNIIENFESLGNDFVVGKRNKIKTFTLDDFLLNVKSFKIPGLFNGLIYRFFRKSKAERSFLHAHLLTKKGIGTPSPIDFYEKKSSFRLLDSYYICEHIHPDYVFIDIFKEELETITTIIKQFTQFTFNLHQEGIEFLDHSPTNTLVERKDASTYKFYLVDLNRMSFHKKLSFPTRMKNFARITTRKDVVQIISSEYALLYGKDEKEVFTTMWKYNLRYQMKLRIKRKLKNIMGIQ